MTSKKRIFLVEDEDIVAMLTEDFLNVLGHEVSFNAATLQIGIKIATSEQFDLGILDINLRGEQSFPIADILSSRGIPYFFVSGYSQQGIDPRFAHIPALQKPFTLQSLETKITQLLG